MHRWSHGACDTWQKHAPLHHDVAQSDVCGHPMQYRNQELIVSPPQRSSFMRQESSRSHWAGHVTKIDSLHHLRMIAPEKKAALAQIGGADLQRFVVHSALLSLIDPVRGEPTRTSLDENPDGDISGGQKLKQKFLDSFALICSTSSSGAETASAVCLEQHAPAGAILRVARNRGLTPKDLTGLEKLLQILQVVARKGTYFI